MTLSQVLDVSLDTLCGRKNLTTEAVSPPAPILPFPRHVGLRILTVGIAVVLVLAAFFVGRATGSLPGAAESVPLPDSLTITGLNFSYDGYNLHYRFTPSVSEPDYTYQIVFTDYRTSVFDVTPVDGVCSGHVKLPAGSYSVTITVKSGDSTRSVAVAEGLSFSKNHTSWIPLTD